MNIELLYTSAPQGLKQGSRGFCTVLSTVGLPINLAQKLESLSAYRHLYQPGDPRADSNPICHSHLRFQVGGRTVSVLSRVAAYGVDYSQRTNKIAHHIALADPLPRCGPAAVLSQLGFMRTEWDNQCRTLSAGPEVPSITLVPSVCQEWEKRTGDAGWAGVVANAWLQTSGKPVWIIFSESQSSNLLAMMNEATAILTENRRWQATFSTYCTNLPPDIDCRVRCVIQGSDEARMAIARGLVIDLTKPMPSAVDSPAAQAARMGHTIGSVTAISASGSHAPTETSGTELPASIEAEVGNSEHEYQLEGSSSSPPALLPPRPKKKRSKSSQAPRTMQRIWKSAAMIGIAAVFLFGLTAGGFYLLWKSTQISEVIATLPNEPELPQQPPIVDQPSKAKAQIAPQAAMQPTQDTVALPDSDQAKKAIEPSPEICLVDMENRITSSIEVNESALKNDYPLGKLQFVNFQGDIADIDIVRVSSNEEKQLIKNDRGTITWIGGAKIPLRKAANDIAFQARYKRSGKDFEKDFTLRIINEDDPNITLTIADAKSVLADSFVADTKLTVTVIDDPDETDVNARKWSWDRKKQDASNWQPIALARTQSYTVTTEDYGCQIRCMLEYNSSTPTATTIVESQIVSCYPPSTLIIKYDDLVRKPAQEIFATVIADFPRSRERLPASETSYTFMSDSEKMNIEDGKLVLKNFHVEKLKSVVEQLDAWQQPARRTHQEVSKSLDAIRRILIKSFSQVGLADTDIAKSFRSRLDGVTPIDFIRYSDQLNHLLIDIEDLARLRISKEESDEILKKKKADLEIRLKQNSLKYGVILSTSNSKSREDELDQFRNVFRNGKMADGVSIANGWENLVYARNRLREALIKPIQIEDKYDEKRRIEVAVQKGDGLPQRTVPPLLSYPIILELDIDTEKSVYELAFAHDNLTSPNWFSESLPHQPQLRSGRQAEPTENLK